MTGGQLLRYSMLISEMSIAREVSHDSARKSHTDTGRCVVVPKMRHRLAQREGASRTDLVSVCAHEPSGWVAGEREWTYLDCEWPRSRDLPHMWAKDGTGKPTSAGTLELEEVCHDNAR